MILVDGWLARVYSGTTRIGEHVLDGNRIRLVGIPPRGGGEKEGTGKLATYSASLSSFLALNFSLGPFENLNGRFLHCLKLLFVHSSGLTCPESLHWKLYNIHVTVVPVL